MLLMTVVDALTPNPRSGKTSAVAAHTKTQQTPFAPAAVAPVESETGSAAYTADHSARTASPSEFYQNRTPPKKAVAAAEHNVAAAENNFGTSMPTKPPLPKDARNNVLKLPQAGWAKKKPCAFAPAALEPTEQRSYKDETDFPELALKYYADPRIHGWGNVGLNGAVHALMAPTFTAALDAFAYGGLDTRNAAWDRVDLARATVGAPPVKNCVDLGTGTGATARSLRKRYQASVVGVDTSREMLRAAKDLTHTGFLDFCTDVTFRRHNAEATGLAGGRADVVSVFFLLHEAPAAARRQILREAFRLLAPGGTLALCDIYPEYNPSPIMLSGEPYLNGYLDNIDGETETSAATHGLRLRREVLVAGRLTLWTFQKAR